MGEMNSKLTVNPFHQIIRKELPRIPLDGYIDLTYRCNNACQHCWLFLAENATEGREELTCDEIKGIVDQARNLGCQAWIISGGEPMIRSDFPEIFEYITRKSVFYKLNTNGTLITPEIAQLMRRKGSKMVALYGASAEVHDSITRNPGSYEATMRGFAYLKEAGAEFIVQVVPMQGNYHQYQQMIKLAESLSPQYRLGAAWLWLSANKSEARNREITRQRLTPSELIEIDPPVYVPHEPEEGTDRRIEESCCTSPTRDDCLFTNCIPNRRDFHIDPYGQMSFCYYVKDPALRFDLRKGSFQQAWEEFIPSLVNSIHGGKEYLENCGACEFRQECHWCGVYGYLEHGRYSARVEYLCKLTAEQHKFREEWKSNHLRYYQLGGITIQVTTDFPITEKTFSPKFIPFQVKEPGEDILSIRLVDEIPELNELRLGREIYHRVPWIISQQRDSWIYRGIMDGIDNDKPYVVAIANKDHSNIIICRRARYYTDFALEALTTFQSDLILFSRYLAEKQGLVMHSSGMILNKTGLLFVGHSGAGKSTMLKLLRGEGEILCDDRIIVRKSPEGFRIHGTWSHGELPDISPNSAPLKAIIFLEQADTTELLPMRDKKEMVGQITAHVIKPLITSEWWEKIFDLTEQIIKTVPIYRLKFEKNERVKDTIKEFIQA